VRTHNIDNNIFVIELKKKKEETREEIKDIRVLKKSPRRDLDNDFFLFSHHVILWIFILFFGCGNSLARKHPSLQERKGKTKHHITILLTSNKLFRKKRHQPFSGGFIFQTVKPQSLWPNITFFVWMFFVVVICENNISTTTTLSSHARQWPKKKKRPQCTKENKGRSPFWLLFSKQVLMTTLISQVRTKLNF